MHLIRLTCALGLTLVMLLPAWPVAAQDSPNRPGERPDSSSTEQDRQQRPGRWRERMREMEGATPEERQSLRLDWQVGMMTRSYDLTEAQQKTVRAELEKAAQEYRNSMGPEKLKKMDKLRAEIRQFWRSRVRDGEEAGRDRWRSLADDPKFVEMRERMSQMQENSPFDWRANIDRVEKLLPKEQAEKGRKRRQERMSGWAGGPRDFQGQRQAWQRPTDENAWGDYVAEFIARYHLDAAQTSAASSVLKDVKERAARFRRTQKDSREKAQALDDFRERRRQLGTLDAPIEALFSELKSRLDRIPTERQRRRAEEL